MSHSKLRPTEVRITTPQDQVVRAGLVVVSVGLLIIGLGFLFKTDWVLRLWPVKEGPLSYLFISSIILAQATALGWTAKTLELNYARGGVLGFAAMNAGFVLFAASRYRQFPDTPLIGWIVVCGLLFLGGMALFFFAMRPHFRVRAPLGPAGFFFGFDLAQTAREDPNLCPFVHL